MIGVFRLYEYVDDMNPVDVAQHKNNEINRMLRFTVGLGLTAAIVICMACGDANTPTSEVQVITLGELLASPDRYDDREILLEGFYFQGWESNLMSERMEPTGFAEGHLWPRGQQVWVEGSIPEAVYNGLHQQEMMGPLERYGKVRIKGTFRFGERYGHPGGFDAQIVPSELEVLPWAPPFEKQ